MTSFATLETGLETSRPIELYRISIGSLLFLYTSNPVDVVYGGDTYASAPIKRGPIAVGQAERSRILGVSLPVSNEFVQLYINVPPGQRAAITIYRLQRDEVPSFNTRVTIYDGSIQSVDFSDGRLATLQVQSLEGVIGRTIPRYTFMSMCNHVLYGPGCDVDQLSFRHIGEVTAATGNVITVAGAGASSLSFTGGYVKPTGVSDYRVVLSQSGDDLTLLLPFHISPIGSQMECSAGCNHLVGGDCSQVFDNVIRYGGFPFVPSRNIFDQGITT